MMENELLGKFKLVVGMEIHFHLKTEKKMFCSCSADIWEKEPNIVVCPVCLGLPGALPVPNIDAVKKTQMMGLALNCSLNKKSRFDRKHYFYPDLPKGYQISQYKQPLCIDGKLKLESGSVVDIERVHLEEDVAKSFHEEGKTLVDFNKSGIPLVEIVTRPCFRNIPDTVEYCKQIQLMVKYLGIGEADMEKGQMRLEVNISLRTSEQERKDELPKYKVEVKNINSFKFMEKAIQSEIIRQRELLENGITPMQENRGFKEGSMKTVPQRSKEEAKDYRYFPEPDIPPMEFTPEYIKDLKTNLPPTPYMIIDKLEKEIGLSRNNAKTMVEKLGPSYISKFEKLLRMGADPIQTSNLLLNKKEYRNVSEEEIIEVIKNTKTAYSKMEENELNAVIKKILANNLKAVEDFKKGKESSVMYLVGEAMRMSSGKNKPDPTQLKQKILDILNSDAN